MIDVAIDPSVRARWRGEAFLGVVHMMSPAVGEEQSRRLEGRADAALSELRRVGRGALDDPMVRRMRATFRAMPEMDPSRYRPASESLIRRWLEKGMFRISPLVDANNILSVQLRVPLGIYRVDALAPTGWVYRIGDSGETYVTFSGQEKNAEGKLVMADQEGVIGSPVADSGRAAVTGEPREVAVIAYLPLDTTAAEADSMVREIEAAFTSIFEPAEAHGIVLT